MASSRTRLRQSLWRTGQFVIVVGAIAAVIYWTQFAPAMVTSHIVQRGEIVAEVMGTGTLESHISATISPKISGLIAGVLVDQGDRAEAGQVLVRLDDSDFSRQVEVSESTLVRWSG